jgi:predicted nucleic acid-binding Zn ribbon protein
LRALTEELGISGRLRDYEVFTSWSALVGEQIARVAEPVRLEKGVLVVHVAGAPWRNELTLRRREIIGRINEGLGNTVVTDIRFR